MTDKPDQNQRPLVLVVEDHDDTRFMLRIFLEHDGCAILEATNGLDALDLAGRENPDLVLIDGNLPGLDGLSAIRRMREQESLRDVPIVALSGHASAEFRNAARLAGCDAYITKPLDFVELRSTMRRLLPTYSHAA
jgi:CheY-like chemotaxis protein